LAGVEGGARVVAPKILHRNCQKLVLSADIRGEGFDKHSSIIPSVYL
jgi:hypothetical protein